MLKTILIDWTILIGILQAAYLPKNLHPYGFCKKSSPLPEKFYKKIWSLQKTIIFFIGLLSVALILQCRSDQAYGFRVSIFGGGLLLYFFVSSTRNVLVARKIRSPVQIILNSITSRHFLLFDKACNT